MNNAFERWLSDWAHRRTKEYLVYEEDVNTDTRMFQSANFQLKINPSIENKTIQFLLIFLAASNTIKSKLLVASG